jgi:anti-anti-sigma regulatory factor
LQPANLPIHIHMVPCEGVKWMALEGELHESNVAAVERTLVALAQTGGLLVLDLGRLIVEDRGVARVFAWTAAVADYAGGALLVADASPTVGEALRGLGAAWLLTPDE